MKRPVCPNQDCPDHRNRSGNNLIKYGKDRKGDQRYFCRSCQKTFVFCVPQSPKPYQRKKTKKGTKSKRGQPEMYEEVKGRVSLALTPTAVKGLDELAESFNISRSELVERIGRRVILLDQNTNA